MEKYPRVCKLFYTTPVGITYYKRLFPRKIYSKTRNILIF